MTEHEPLERYLDDFGAQLSGAKAASSESRLRNRRVALGTTVAVVTAVLVASLVGASGEQLDPVAKAQAALASPGEIIYMKLTSEVVDPRATRVPPPQTTETWSALDPPRWRLVQTLPPFSRSQGGSMDEHGPIEGRQEIAYAHGEQSSYLAKRDTLETRQGLRDDGPAAQAPSLLTPGTGDIQTDLRSMLADGDVTDEGEQLVDGRTVRRLVSEERSDSLVRRLIYDVDPQTFAPIQGTLTFRAPSRDRPWLKSRVHVDAYKRVPLNETTLKLLEIHTTPQTKVTVHTARELRKADRRFRKSCRKLKSGDLACAAAPGRR